MTTPTLITLISSDEEEFKVAKEVAEHSVTVKNIIEDVNDTSQPIPLPNVNGKILKKVIEYCQHYHDTPHEIVTDNSGKIPELDEYCKTFCNVEQQVLFETILASNYLDIKPLLDLTCRAVANMIRGKTPEEIKKVFNIKKDFSPEEEEQVRKENEWCEER